MRPTTKEIAIDSWRPIGRRKFFKHDSEAHRAPSFGLQTPNLCSEHRPRNAEFVVTAVFLIVAGLAAVYAIVP